MYTCPECAEPLPPGADYCEACGIEIALPPRKSSSSTIIIIVAVVCVVGIMFIGILAAMLLPVLNKVKHKANASNCKNNLKQLGLGLILYRDNQGKGRSYPDRNGGAFLVHLYETGVTSEPDLFSCPSVTMETDPTLLREATASQGTTYAGRRNKRQEVYPGLFSDRGTSETSTASDDDMGSDPAHEDAVIVLFADGHVEEISRVDPRLGELGRSGLLHPLAD